MPYVFLHLPKTAGLSLREVLKRMVPPGAVNSKSPLPFDEMERKYDALVRYIETGDRSKLQEYNAGWESPDPNERFIKSLGSLSRKQLRKIELFMDHYFYGIHELFDRPVTYLTMLRHPVERTLSHHQHWVARHGLRTSLRDVVENNRPASIDNRQTRQIVGGLNDGRDIREVPLDDDLFGLAKEHLRSFEWVGVTEKFDESLVTLQARFGIRDVSYRRVNVGEGRVRREDVPPDIIRRIENVNRYDDELWRLANQLLDEDTRRTQERKTIRRSSREAIWAALPGAVMDRLRTLRDRARGS